MLTVSEGVVLVTALLYDFCHEIRGFVDTPDVNPCPTLILLTEVGRAATQTELGEDELLSSTLSFVVVETAMSTKVCVRKLGRGRKRVKVLVEARRYDDGGGENTPLGHILHPRICMDSTCGQ